MQNFTTQVCIIGAGPAGLTASLFLSKFGIPHIVIDKSHFPRDKVCGECYDGRVGRTLDALDPDYLPELKAEGLLEETWRYSLHLKGTELVVNFPKDNRPKLLSKRLDFDQFLLHKAQEKSAAQIITGTAIQHIKKTKDGVLLEGENIRIETRLVIIANGSHPTFQKEREEPVQSMIYGRRYYENIIPRSDNEVEVYYFQKPLRGCLVICPLPENQYNVELGFTKAAYKKCGQSLTEILDAYLASETGLSERFASATPLNGMKGTHLPLPNKIGICAEDHVLRAGSNVYSFNPLTGAGVGNAMIMGRLAAETAKQCVEQDNYSYHITKNYERAVQKQLKQMISFNRSVNRTLRYVHLLEWLLPFVMRRRIVKKILGQTDFVRRIFG